MGGTFVASFWRRAEINDEFVTCQLRVPRGNERASERARASPHGRRWSVRSVVNLPMYHQADTSRGRLVGGKQSVLVETAWLGQAVAAAADEPADAAAAEAMVGPAITGKWCGLSAAQALSTTINSDRRRTMAPRGSMVLPLRATCRLSLSQKVSRGTKSGWFDSLCRRCWRGSSSGPMS